MRKWFLALLMFTSIAAFAGYEELEIVLEKGIPLRTKSRDHGLASMLPVVECLDRIIANVERGGSNLGLRFSRSQSCAIQTYVDDAEETARFPEFDLPSKPAYWGTTLDNGVTCSIQVTPINFGYEVSLGTGDFWSPDDTTLRDAILKSLRDAKNCAEKAQVVSPLPLTRMIYNYLRPARSIL